MASRRFSPHHHADFDRTEERQHRYRLVVLGVGVGDVVESIGGFLCDRARAGWDVRVFLDLPCAQPRDARPRGVARRGGHPVDDDEDRVSTVTAAARTAGM